MMPCYKYCLRFQRKATLVGRSALVGDGKLGRKNCVNHWNFFNDSSLAKEKHVERNRVHL